MHAPNTPDYDHVAEQQPPKVLFLNFSSDLSPQKLKKEKKPKQQNTYLVNGVNILNRTNIDSKTAIERMQKRRENHNHIERKRRDTINHTILELSKVIPDAAELGRKCNKGEILQMALAHIQALQAENTALREKVDMSRSPASIPSPSSSTLLDTTTSTTAARQPAIPHSLHDPRMSPSS